MSTSLKKHILDYIKNNYSFIEKTDKNNPIESKDKNSNKGIAFLDDIILCEKISRGKLYKT